MICVNKLCLAAAKARVAQPAPGFLGTSASNISDRSVAACHDRRLSSQRIALID
jgi:hypothetical protein